MPQSRTGINTVVGVTYFEDATEFCITDGQLFVSLLRHHLLQHLLQTFTNFTLDKGGGS